jgi:PEP-CTERM motif-containing protein
MRTSSVAVLAQRFELVGRGTSPDQRDRRLQMKRLVTIGAVGTIMMLSVTPITIAHADPLGNDTLTINGSACPLVDDSNDGAVGFTRCNFPAGFNPPNRGRVSLTEPDGTISDILWTHLSHFHYISDPSLTVIAGHRGEFGTDLGSVAERAGNIDVSANFGLPANSVVVTSDVVDNGPDRVPEPGTLSLLVVGLAGLGYRLGQRKRKRPVSYAA